MLMALGGGAIRMYELKHILQESNPYASGSALVSLRVGDIPDLPTEWLQTSSFFTFLENNLFGIARQVLNWWTPGRVEQEALRLAGDVEGPSVLAREAYTLRVIYMQVSLLVSKWAESAETAALYSGPSASLHANAAVRRAEMLCGLIRETVETLERKAQQLEARAMDHRLRFDAQQLRAMLAGHEVSSKLSQLIEAAQRDGEAQEHLLQLVADLREPIERAAQAMGSIRDVADWCWDRQLHTDADAKKLSTTIGRVGTKTVEFAVAALLSALASRLMPK